MQPNLETLITISCRFEICFYFKRIYTANDTCTVYVCIDKYTLQFLKTLLAECYRSFNLTIMNEIEKNKSAEFERITLCESIAANSCKVKFYYINIKTKFQIKQIKIFLLFIADDNFDIRMGMTTVYVMINFE